MTNPIVVSWRKRPEVTRGYIVAVISTAAAAVVGFALRAYLDRSVFILFTAPIALASWYGGKRPALVATILGLVAADVVFLEHSSLLVPTDLNEVIASGVFLFVGLIIVHLGTLLRQSRDEAQENASTLQDQALELELQKTELEQQTQEAQTLTEELEQVNEELKLHTHAQLAEAQALARLGSWEWEIASNRITWSDEMYRLYGIEPGIEVDYERYQSLVHPEDREVAHDAVVHSMRTGAPFSFDHRVIRPDGAERIFHARGRVVMDNDGKPLRMYGTGQDVTETRKASAALQTAAEYAARQATAEAAAQHLNRVFAQAPVVIAVLAGPEHRFEMVNEKGYEIIGRSLLGRTITEALPELVAQGFGQLLDRVFQNNEPFIGSEVFARLSDDAEGGYFNFVFQPLSNDQGVYAVLVVATDVTALVKARMAAENAQKEALAASRAKSDFVARMSHELRTPLAAIIGYGELLADGITGPVNDEQKRQLQRIRWSANHLLSIIDEILTLARMEAGKETVEIREVEVSELLDSVASMAAPLASAKGLDFAMDDADHEMVVDRDAERFGGLLDLAAHVDVVARQLGIAAGTVVQKATVRLVALIALDFSLCGARRGTRIGSGYS